MSRNLAEQGFNICIISRSEDKINKCLEKIREDFGVQTKSIPADLAQIRSVNGYYLLVEKHLNDVDIGIVAINAGMVGDPGHIDQLPDSQIEQVYTLNCLQHAYFAKAISEKLTGRSKRAAMVIVSSGIAELTAPGVTSYCSTKSF